MSKLELDYRALREGGWNFDWSKPFDSGETVVKLTLENSQDTQGLIAFRDMPSDRAVVVDLMESAPSNVGSSGKYSGVGGHLFAIAAQESVKKGYGGFVYFTAKGNLIGHYVKELGATPVKGATMQISEQAAQRLIKRYFKNE